MPAEQEMRRNNGAGIFIPAGIFLGLGAGFLFNNIPAGLFVGLGAGFLLFAIFMVIDRR
jgi:hypothetical protein